MTEPQTFRKRKGTTNKGVDYEHYNVAYQVLKLVSDKNVQNFHISSNDDAYDAFDDIVVNVELPNKNETYAIQLKHSDRGKLSKEKLKEQKGDFSINKYFTSFKKIKKPVDQYILFTNLTFTSKDDIDIEIGPERFVVKPIEEFRCCYQFKLIYPTEVKKRHEFRCFLRKFRLYESQQNLASLKTHLKNKFKQKYSSDGFDTFFLVISEWSKKEGEKEMLTKEWMQNAIAIHALSSKIKPLSFCKEDENMKILREAIEMFDVTLLQRESSYEIVRNLWGDIKGDLKDTKEINKIRKKYQLDSTFIKDFDKSNAILSSKLLWLMGKCPLVVTKDETVEKVIQICKRNNFIVIDENLDKGWVKFPAFQKLSDLKKKNSTKLDEIVSKFTLSLQGKNCTLKKLVDEDEQFLDLITIDDLLEMSKGTFRIGGDKEILCEPYINRFLSRNIIDIKFLENIKDETLVFIDCVDNESNLKKKFPKHDFVSVDGYHKEETDERMKLQQNSKLKSSNTYRIGGGTKIYISRNRCNISQFQEVYTKNKQKVKGHHFRLVNSDTLEWVRSKGDIEGLEEYKIYDKFFVPEKNLFGSVLENNINVIIGDPGLGKSELMKSLKNNCLDTFWTMIMYPKDIFTLCQNFKNGTPKKQNVEQLMFDIKCKSLSAKEQNVFHSLAKQKKIMYVWEALDEVSSEHVKQVTKVIKEFSEKGYIQWITSRFILKTYLEKTFDVLAININKFNEQEQQSYIYDRLKHHCDSHKIEKVVDKLKSTFVLIEHFDILGIPLQLYMLTELFLQDVDGYLEKFTNTFVLTDLYHYFVEEKFNVYFKDKLKTDMQIPGNKVLFKSYKSEALKYFQIMSMRTLLSETILKDLNYENDIQNAELIAKYNSIGIVTEINNDIPRFIHGSFAEYFVAFYFSKNIHLNTIMSVMQAFVFDEKYNNVRFFFDVMLAKSATEQCLAHIAVLYKNYELLKQYDREILTRKDVGGRTVLHLASSWGQRCPMLPVEKMGETFIIDDDGCTLETEQEEFQQVFHYLLKICISNETDSLFKMDCLSYAKKTSCVFAQIQLMYHQKFKLNESVDNLNLLYYSALFGHRETFEMLYSNNLATSYRNGPNTTVELLMAKGIEINLANKDGLTPLYITSQNGHNKIVEFLVKNGADINHATKYSGRTLLYAASLKGHLTVVEFLVAYGAQINLADKNGFTPLRAASENGHDKIVEFLVAKGAEINRTNTYFGSTALYIASQNGHDKIVKFLVEKGAEINLASKEGLDANGAGINLTDKYFNGTPLYVACKNGHNKIVDFLIVNGAEINISDAYSGSTPLYVASQNGHDKIVEFLIEKGAEINLANKFSGRTPLYVASQMGHDNIVQYLVAEDAEVNLANKYGSTPLYIASRNGHDKIVEFLVEKGAEINLANKYGKTPLYVASENSHDKIVQFLVAKGAKNPLS